MIAAALALEPEALVCDEPVSALDVSVRTQVLRLLADLRVSRALSLLLITHDVGLAWSMCDRVAVMYLGRIVELGTTEQVLGDPSIRTRRPCSRWPRASSRARARACCCRASRPTRPRSHRGAVSILAARWRSSAARSTTHYLPDTERAAACWLVQGTTSAVNGLRSPAG